MHLPTVLKAGALVVEYRHTDREPDVVPAEGVTMLPRTYGVYLPDRTPGAAS